MTGATEAGALEVVSESVDLLTYLAAYTAQLPAGPVGYYINDRFLEGIPDDLVESLLSLFANATSPRSLILIAPAPNSVDGRDNSDTAFGYRDTFYVWVWPFWARTAGGAEADGESSHFAFVGCFRVSFLELVCMLGIIAPDC